MVASAVLAEFVTAQAALVAAEAEFDAHRQLAKEISSARDAALEVWNAKLMALGSFTESATGGVATKILSAGFDVRSEPSRPQPVGQVMNVVVEYPGTPGYSLVTWKREPVADAYMVQVSPEPITETSWKNMGTVRRPKYEGNGATPGQRCWYRVAGVNALGQGCGVSRRCVR